MRAIFWGGPLHGQVRWVDQYRVVVPILQDVAVKVHRSGHWNDPAVAVGIEYVEYHTQVFGWDWKGYAQEAYVMTSSFADVLKVEAVMQFLETLWGKR